VLTGRLRPGLTRGEQLRCLTGNLRWAADLPARDGRTLVIEPINDRDVPGYLLPRAASPAEPRPRASVMTRVCLLHTVTSLPAVFAGLLPDEVGAVDVVNIVDETLLQDTIEHGMLARTRRRVAAYAGYAEESGAAAVLVTCSSIGEAAEEARASVGIPVYRVDAPMAAEAVAAGGRLGVLATLAATLQPTGDLLRRESAAASEILESVCPGAFEALRNGDTERHDAIVGAEVRRLAAEVDVLVLAQASMARVVANLPADEVPAKVLTSPRSGVRQLRPYASS
jgi:hypothetical protein